MAKLPKLDPAGVHGATCLLPEQGSAKPTATDVPAWQLVVSWAILVPLFYVCANGTFLPDKADVSLSVSPISSLSHMIQEALVLGMCCVLIASRFQALLSIFPRAKIFVALPLLTILSALWSVDPRQSAISGIPLLIFTMFALYLGTRFTFRRQFELIMLLSGIVLPLSIFLALFVPWLGRSEAGWSGIFGHKQNCAAVSLFLLITALHWKSSGVYQKIFRAANICMCLLLIMMSGSRIGWALALVALALSAFIWLLQKMPAKDSLLVGAFALVATACLAYGINSYSSVIFSAIGKDPTLSQRTSIWAAVWAEILKRPILGYGFAAFWKGLYGPSHDVVLFSGWDVFQAQNGYLDVWLSVGVLGVAVIGLMVWQSMNRAVRSFRGPHGSYVRWSVVVIVCVLLLNIGESTIGRLQLTWLFFLLASINLRQEAEGRRESVSVAKDRWRKGAECGGRVAFDE